MEALRKIADRFQTTVPDSIGKQCEKHLPKTVNLILVDGEEVCPLCERDRENEMLSRIETAKYKSSLNRKKYSAFADKSILTNVDLYDASFGNYEAAEQEEVTNKEKAMKTFKKYKSGEVFNTWLTGMPGVGKSHLAMSILRNLNESGEKNKACIFVSVDEMLRMIRSSFDNKESKYTEFYFVDLLSNADYIVLDDLGAETGGTGTKKTATDFTLRVLYAIANARQDKPTIVTTNLSKEELVKMYDAKLVSRLRGSQALIKFTDTSDKRMKTIEL